MPFWSMRTGPTPSISENSEPLASTISHAISDGVLLVSFMSTRKTIESIRPSVLEICKKNATSGQIMQSCIGTGFLIHRSWAVTCAHVIKKFTAKELSIRYHLNANGDVASGSFKIQAIKKVPDVDLALLEVSQVVGRPHRPVHMDHSPDRWVGEPVFSAGYPLGTRIQETSRSRVVMVTSGIIGDIVQDVNPTTNVAYILDITAHPGCSGAPIFTAQGAIGVLDAGHAVFAASARSAAQLTRIGVGHARAIPIEFALAHLRTLGVRI